MDKIYYFTKESHPLHEKVLVEIPEADFIEYVGEHYVKRVRNILNNKTIHRNDVYSTRTGHVVVMDAMCFNFLKNHGVGLLQNWDLIGYRMICLDGFEKTFATLDEMYVGKAYLYPHPYTR